MTDSDTPSTDNPHRSRSRLPSAGGLFVGTLLCVLVALCLLIGWPVHRQQARLRHFQQIEGGIETVPVGPQWLRDLVARRLGDEYAAGFTELTWLVLDGTSVTDAGLDYLTGCTELRGLCLANTRITDAGLSQLGGLSHLEVLSLHNTDVSNAGLFFLSRLPNLRKLYLSRTRVTDAGLSHLYRLSNMEELWLQETEVTSSGIEELQSRLTECAIKVSAEPM